MEDPKRTALAKDRRQGPADLADDTGWEPEDSHGEVARVLWSKRWEVRDGPFQGFGSPPGKF